MSRSSHPDEVDARRWPALRPWLLPVAVLAWLWAGSVFTPWAEDRLPRLWLYDALYYLGFALLAWALAEAIHLGFHWRNGRRAALIPLAASVLIAATAHAAGTGPGIDLRVELGRPALDALADRGYDDVRRRAGLFLVDTVRQPCGRQVWLWLGRPHGGGTGTNIALVRAEGHAPLTPAVDAFVFRHVRGRWWMAYQHAARFHAASQSANALPVATSCAPGRVISGHRDGLVFVDAGRQSASGP